MSTKDALTDDQVRVVPANEASCADLQAVFANADAARDCHCQWFKLDRAAWDTSTEDERRAAVRSQTSCGHAGAAATTGLVAYVDGAPAGWAAVEPRTRYPRLQTLRTPWSGRAEDRDDDTVWAVPCLVVRRGFRGRGVTYHLARAAVAYARSHGATAIEGYPMITEAGKEIGWGELYVGARQVFTAAGFSEVSHPTKRRVVMRLELQRPARGT